MPENPTFHAHDGLKFERHEDGAVSIHFPAGLADSIKLDEATWQSAIAAVSSQGERQIVLAKYLHSGKPSPLSEKLRALRAAADEKKTARAAAIIADMVAGVMETNDVDPATFFDVEPEVRAAGFTLMLATFAQALK